MINLPPEFSAHLRRRELVPNASLSNKKIKYVDIDLKKEKKN